LAGHFDREGRVAEASDDSAWAPGNWIEQIDGNTLYRMLTPGGGGWGDPLARDPEAVRRDVRDGFVSATAAREVYGVELLAGPAGPSSLAVDLPATERLRAVRSGDDS
jgi:N-methylhydantoinase B